MKSGHQSTIAWLKSSPNLPTLSFIRTAVTCTASHPSSSSASLNSKHSGQQSFSSTCIQFIQHIHSVLQRQSVQETIQFMHPRSVLTTNATLELATHKTHTQHIQRFRFIQRQSVYTTHRLHNPCDNQFTVNPSDGAPPRCQGPPPAPPRHLLPDGDAAGCGRPWGGCMREGGRN
jgi:hypothetical protein